MPLVRFRYSDGSTAEVGVAAGQAILDAALAANIPLIHQCKSGTCGSCVAHLSDGQCEAEAGTISALLHSEHEAGFRLTCISSANTDCVLDLDYARSFGEVKPQRVNSFIDGIDWIASNVVRLRLELADGDDLSFRPGQFVQVKVPGTTEQRSYSMASAPDQLPRLEFLIRVLPDGVMSNYLRDRAAIDDVLELRGPYGSFYWREKVSAPHILVAGGTGLAPMMSIMDAIRKAPGRKPPILLTFGCPDSDSLFHCDELDARRFWMPYLQTRISVDRGGHDDAIIVGNPVSSLSPDDVGGPDTVAYLCGPPRMIEAAHERLTALGVKPSNIYAEQFVPSQ